MQGSLREYSGMKAFRKDLNLARDGVNYALMPVWQYAYRYQNKIYQFHVNGQTGKVVGKTPVSAGKVAFYGATVLALVTSICYLAIGIMEIL